MWAIDNSKWATMPSMWKATIAMWAGESSVKAIEVNAWSAIATVLTVCPLHGLLQTLYGLF